MAGDFAVGAEHREDIDEAEEFDLEPFILHGPGHESIIPPAPLPRPVPFLPELSEKLAADLLRAIGNRSPDCRLEVVIPRVHGSFVDR